MQYREQSLRYDWDEEWPAESNRRPASGTQYRLKRTRRGRRRLPVVSPAHPGCGMGGRRNRRWNW